MSNGEKLIIVCIPAFNTARTIGKIIRDAKKYCSNVIVCNDGSVDNTKKVAELNGAIVVSHTQNEGYGAAIKTLFNEAKKRKADVMVTLDADGQHDVEDIKKIIKPLIKNECDIVIGSRFLNKVGVTNVPFYRNIGIKTITKLTHSVSYRNLSDSQSGFRAYNKKTLNEISLKENGMAVSTEILMQAKKKNLTVKEIPITISYDVEKPSSLNPITHGFGVAMPIIRFISLKHPLKFYTIPGSILLGIAFGFLFFALTLFAETRFISTNMIIISIGSAAIGIMLMVTGIILYSIIALFEENGFKN